MKAIQRPIIDSTFIDILTDYGFKLIFGSEEHKEILRRFLNALFEGQMYIETVEFHDKEVLPADNEGKRVIYDVYCTTDTKHHFIVEMQQQYGPTFEKRIIHYSATGIVLQSRRGGNYDFDPVYTIVFTDFDMKQLTSKLINEILLMDRESHKVLSEDLKIYFLSLKHVKKDWDDCENELDKLLYLVKNMVNMDKSSKAYRSKEYLDLFDAAEVSNMASEAVVEYSRSLQRKKEIMEAIDYASEESYSKGIEKGFEQGIEKGFEQGIEQGIEQGMMEIIKMMSEKGLSPKEVASLTGLSLNKIISFLN